jgi:homoserine kinase
MKAGLNESILPFWLRAAMVPSGTPISTATAIANSASSMVAGNAADERPDLLRRLMNDRPKSSRRTSLSHHTYRTGSG